MASSGSMTRPPYADKVDMPNKRGWASLNNYPKKDVKIPTCWCEDECLVKVSRDRGKAWTEGRRFFVCPNYKYDKKHPYAVGRERSPSPPPLCGYFSWIDDKVPKDVKYAQDLERCKKQFQLEQNRLLNEKYEAKEKEAEERRKRQMDTERKEAEAREGDRARKLARARAARAEDEARDKKGKGPMFPY